MPLLLAPKLLKHSFGSSCWPGYMQLKGRIVTVPPGVGADDDDGDDDGASDVGCEDGEVLGSAMGDALGNNDGLKLGGPFTHTFVDISPDAVSP